MVGMVIAGYLGWLGMVGIMW